MEILRAFLVVLRFRWPLALACSLAVAAFLLLGYRPKSPQYLTRVNLEIGQVPLPSTKVNEEERYYGWVTSEYIAISLRDWANGADFVDQVRWRLWVDGIRLSRLEIDEAFRADVQSTSIGLTAMHEDRVISEQIAEAAMNAFAMHEQADIPQNQLTQVVAEPLDVLFVAAEPGVKLGHRIAVPGRLLIGIFSGVLIVILSELLFARIYTGTMIETMNLPLMGEIPRQ